MDVSTIGCQLGLLGTSSRPLAIWLSEIKLVKPDLVMHECTVKFTRELFNLYLAEYDMDIIERCLRMGDRRTTNDPNPCSQDALFSNDSRPSIRSRSFARPLCLQKRGDLSAEQASSQDRYFLTEEVLDWLQSGGRLSAGAAMMCCKVRLLALVLKRRLTFVLRCGS